MKTSARRTLAMILCVLTVFSLLPVTAYADYNALSSKKVKIYYPTEFFYEVMTAKITGGNKGKDKKSVYIVPRPETGNGDLGTLTNGSRVVILAEENDYYFYMTTSGKLGWTNKKYFTEPTEIDSGYLFGESGLTVDHIEGIKDFIRDGKCGYASGSYYANRAVLVMKKGETKKLTTHRKWNGQYHVTWYNDILKVTWPRNNSNVSIKGTSRGSVTLYFSNDMNDQEFSVRIIVV